MSLLLSLFTVKQNIIKNKSFYNYCESSSIDTLFKQCMKKMLKEVSEMSVHYKYENIVKLT